MGKIVIDNHIDEEFRKYSIYTLENRGIPNFQDGLTNVQRFILINAPKGMHPTTYLIGECFKDGYHHGDGSLADALSRMIRTYDNAMPLLCGDGFFGNLTDGAAAFRYTKVHSNKDVDELMDKYKMLNTKNVEGYWDYIHLDYPIGLCLGVYGIGVAYNSQILPRKLSDIKNYLDNNTKTQLKPYFNGFKGDVKRSVNSKKKKSWLLSANVEYNKISRIITITDLPPIMKYSTYVDDMEKYLDSIDGLTYQLTNNTRTDLDIKIKFKRLVKVKAESIVQKIRKISSKNFTEQLVFTYSGSIIKYGDIKEYLDDFKIFRNHTILKSMKHLLSIDERELNYCYAYLDFYKFMSIESNRKNDLVNKFMGSNKYTKSDEYCRNKLKSIQAYKMTDESLSFVKDEILNLKKNIKSQNVDIKKFKSSNDIELKISGKSVLSI